MPIIYERDDVRRLITVTVTDPFSLEDILGSLDRQVAEETWAYSRVYDVRTARLLAGEEAEKVSDHIRLRSEGREAGPLALRIAPRGDQVRDGMAFTKLTTGFTELEILVTPQQFDAWLERNARRPVRSATEKGEA